jgi:hypothetical protein
LNIVAIHEAGHAIVANKLGIKIKQVHVSETSGQVDLIFQSSIDYRRNDVMEVYLAGWAAEVAIFCSKTKWETSETGEILSMNARRDLENLFDITKKKSDKKFNLESFTKEMVPMMEGVRRLYFWDLKQMAYLEKVAEDIEKKKDSYGIVSDLKISSIMKNPTGYKGASIIAFLKGDSIWFTVGAIVLGIFSLPLIVWTLQYFHII